MQIDPTALVPGEIDPTALVPGEIEGGELEDEFAEEVAGEVGSTISFTADEIPELSGLAEGDILTLRIAGVSEDGESFDMEVVPAVEEVPLEEPIIEEGVPGEEVTAAMLR